MQKKIQNPILSHSAISLIPDPIKNGADPDPKAVIPDPKAVIPDPIYLATTLKTHIIFRKTSSSLKSIALRVIMTGSHRDSP